MNKRESLRVGVVMRRQPSRHRWQDHLWRAVAVLPGAPETENWRLLHDTTDATDYLAATLPIDLFPGETSGYLQNLAQQTPVVYVVLRPNEGGSSDDPDCPVRPFHVTVCPFEAQDYLDGDDQVEVVPMPQAIASWTAEFARRNHVERPFEKRRRRDTGGEGSHG